MKKAISMITAVFLLMTVLAAPMPAEVYGSTAEGTPYDTGITGGNIYYIEESGEITITGCDETVTSAEIPSEIDGILVTAIGDYAFAECSSLTEMTIPGSTTIGNYAFQDCSNLAEITISEGVTSIGNCAFAGCSSLTNVTIPVSVTAMGVNVFPGCSRLTEITVDENNTVYEGKDGVLFNEGLTQLMEYPKGNSRTSYTIPDSVTSIGDGAFAGSTNLKTVTIPEGVTSISGAFDGCSSLAEIIVDNGNEAYESYEGVLFNEGLTHLMRHPAGSSRESYTIPGSVTSIEASAFAGSTNLKTVTIPASVTSIGFEAFIGCSSLTIYGETGSAAQTYANNNNIPFIDPSASELKDISRCTVGAIGAQAYTGKAITPDITVKDGAAVLKKDTDYTVSYANNINPGTASVTIKGKGSYTGTKTASFAITKPAPAAVTKKNQTAKKANKIVITADTSKNGSATVKSIKKTNQKTVTVPAKITAGGYEYDVTAIAAKAFKNCKKATKIVLPGTITKINKNAFNGAKKVKVIKFTGRKAPAIKKGAFKGLNTKKMTVQISRKMPDKQYSKLAKALKKAGFKGKIKKVK